MTLVISETAKPIRTLWALMATEDLEIAKDSLRIREGISRNNFETFIASVTVTENTTEERKLTIQNWAKFLNLDAVIWTNLPAKFREADKREPTLNEAIEYINSLDVNTRKTAEEYIRRAPKQIDTKFRREFENRFGWTFKL